MPPPEVIATAEKVEKAVMESMNQEHQNKFKSFVNNRPMSERDRNDGDDMRQGCILHGLFLKTCPEHPLRIKEGW